MSCIETLDERDAAILAERVAKFDGKLGPRVGDYVEFADGITRRISHDWDDAVQTSDSGSWYLGDGYCNFSGGLFPPVAVNALSLTEDDRMGTVWFFHHDHWTAHNGVNVEVPFRVYVCLEDAPS